MTKWCEPLVFSPNGCTLFHDHALLQVLSSTIIRGMLAEGRQPDHRALHPSVFEFIQQRGLYGLPRAAAAGSSASGNKAAPMTAATRPSSVSAPCAQGPPSSAPAPAARPNPWGANSKSSMAGDSKGASSFDTKAAPMTAATRPSSVSAPCAQEPPSSAPAPAARPNPWGANSKSASAGGSKGAAGGGDSRKTGGGSPKAAAETCTPQAIAAEINAELAHGPLTRRCHVVVFFGAHGTGKGSVAEALCSKRNYKHVSFGACTCGVRCSVVYCTQHALSLIVFRNR